MTQRLTPKRLEQIASMELPKGRAVIAIAELLDEVHALREDRDRLFEDLSRAELEIAELRNEVASLRLEDT